MTFEEVLYLRRLTYHNETVADPQTAPTGRAFWDVHRLTVHGDNVGRGLADNAPEEDQLSKRLNFSFGKKITARCRVGWQHQKQAS